MKNISRIRSTLLALLILGLVAPFAQADAVLRDMRGNITTFDASQTPGQWTVVMIWASDCHVCNAESGQYSAFHHEHADKDANIIGISIDGGDFPNMPYAQTQRLQAYFDAANSVDAGKIAKSQENPAKIPAAIDLARIRAIANLRAANQPGLRKVDD